MSFLPAMVAPNGPEVQIPVDDIITVEPDLRPGRTRLRLYAEIEGIDRDPVIIMGEYRSVVSRLFEVSGMEVDFDNGRLDYGIGAYQSAADAYDGV